MHLNLPLNSILYAVSFEERESPHQLLSNIRTSHMTLKCPETLSTTLSTYIHFGIPQVTPIAHLTSTSLISGQFHSR